MSSATGTPAPQVEWQLASDMVRRGLPAAPALVAAAGLGWGWNGAASAAYALVLVLGNLVVAAALLSWAARRSLGLLAGVALGGFVVRMAVVVLAVAAVRHAAWVELLPLGLTILVTQLGLLWWETRHVSLSLAFPGLKPPPGRS